MIVTTCRHNVCTFYYVHVYTTFILRTYSSSVCPNRYLPIIPMVLVNGSEGIASGYSSYIPSYNPINVIDNILRLLDNNQCKPVVPWYKDFKGVIHKSVKGWHKVDGNITRGPPGKATFH